MTFIAGESKPLRIATRYDLSGATGLSLVVHRPDGSSFIVTNPDLQVGTVDVTAGGETVAANTYVTWRPSSSHFPQKGRYKLQLSVTGGAGLELASVTKSLVVEARLVSA